MQNWVTLLYYTGHEEGEGCNANKERITGNKLRSFNHYHQTSTVAAPLPLSTLHTHPPLTNYNASNSSSLLLSWNQRFYCQQQRKKKPRTRNTEMHKFNRLTLCFFHFLYKLAIIKRRLLSSLLRMRHSYFLQIKV